MLLDYFSAGFPAVAIETVEEQRAITKITDALKLSHPQLITLSIDGTGTFHTADGTKNGENIHRSWRYAQTEHTC